MRSKVIIIISIILVMFLSWFLFFDKRIYLKVNNKVNVFTCYDNAEATYKSKLLPGENLKNISVDGKVDTNHIGKYNVVYTIKYHNKVKKFNKTIDVVDNISPIIKSDEKVEVCPNSTNIKVDYTAFDNYDGDITNKVIQEIKDDSLYLSVEDSSKNKITKKININYYDSEKPSIILNGDKEVYLYRGNEYIEEGYSAIDNCDGNMTSLVKISSNLNINENGKYEIKYSVIDKEGNKAEAIRKINVYDDASMTITPKGKTIYLTFDDGPNANTEKLLDILKKYNVKATFFVTGQFGYEHLIKRAYDEGHSIGLHTYSHNYHVYDSEEAYFDDLKKIDDVVYNTIGIHSKIIRFPGGSSNTISSDVPGIMTRLSKMVASKGYKYFDWNVASNDTSNISSEKIASNIINSLGGGYYVVLQHDIKLKSVDAVEEVIEYGLAHGYTFAPLDITSPGAHHGINN